jgi:hypothetical protein
MSSSFRHIPKRTLKTVLKRAPGLIAACVMALFSPLLGAQAYPAKPVRIIVPVGVGLDPWASSAEDLSSRIKADYEKVRPHHQTHRCPQ